MDVDTGFAVRLFRHHTRDKRNTQQKQLMCQTVYGDGIKSRIGKYDLIFAAGSRITVIGSLQIGLQVFTDFWNPPHKRNGCFLCKLFQFFFLIVPKFFCIF